MSNNSRQTQAQIDPMFTDRWSPRSFNGELLESWEIESLLEAARWAPSCYNEQPWSFAFTKSKEDIKLFSEALVELNQQWAPKAGMLMFLIYKKDFEQTGKPNNWAYFDAGAAWMSLAFQARKIGLYTHGMAGFDRNKAAEILKVDLSTHDIAEAIAVGHIDSKDKLPDKFIDMETPNDRKDLDKMIWNWK
ncbi:MAG: nitroreductase family protein [Sedimentisphaeraceae bacterium JB056]